MIDVELELDGGINTFVPGSAIKGRVTCSGNGKWHKTAQLRITFMGIENCNVKGHLYENEETRSFDSCMDRVIVEIEKIFDGPLSESPTRGTVKCDFYIRLPEVLPSTLFVKFGSISYYLQALLVVLRPGDNTIISKTQNKIIITSPVINIHNYSQEFFKRYLATEEINIGCACFHSGNVQLSVDFPTRVFTMGRPIYLELSIENASTRKISRVLIKTYARIYFRTDEDDEKWKKFEYSNGLIAKKMVCGKLRRRAKRHWYLELTTPMFKAVPNFQGSKLFCFSFDLEVVVYTEWCGECFSSVVHTRIGHV